MMTFLQSKWTAAVVGAVCYFGTIALLWRPVFANVRRAETKRSPRALLNAAHLSDHEMDLLAADLRANRRALDERQQQLQRWEARLQTEQEEFRRLAVQVDKKCAEFDQLVTRISTNEAANLINLAGACTEMPPAAATALLKQIDDERLVKILALLERKPLAAILEQLAKGDPADVKRAAVLLERLRLVIPPATPKPPESQ
jgi:flagellar motility protein MotE (MotC chaperone)